MDAKTLVTKLHRLGYKGSDSPIEPPTKHAEMALHEMCHAALLGDCLEREISHKILQLSPKGADTNELKTLALELLVLKHCKIKISAEGSRALVSYAADGMQTKKYSFSLSAVDKRVKALVKSKSILAMAKKIVKRLENA